jgi:hypothetical protein
MKRSAISVLTACVLACGPAAAQSVTNGSFEQFTGELGNITPGDGASLVAPGSIVLTGWTIVGNNIAINTNIGIYNAFTPFGSNQVDLTGYVDSLNSLGTLQQVVSGFTTNAAYRLSFWLGLQDIGCGSIGNICRGPNGAIVSIGSTTQSFTHESSPVGAPSGREVYDLTNPLNGQTVARRIWDPFSLDFVATDTSMLLSFKATDAVLGQNVYSGLDNVSISALNTTVVPVPAAGWLLLSGLVGFGALARRKSAAA